MGVPRRIAGVLLPDNKVILYALRASIYGIGLTTSKKILSALNVPFDIRVQDLDEEQFKKIENYIATNITIEGALKAQIKARIDTEVRLGSFNGRKFSSKSRNKQKK